MTEAEVDDLVRRYAQSFVDGSGDAEKLIVQIANVAPDRQISNMELVNHIADYLKLPRAESQEEATWILGAWLGEHSKRPKGPGH